MKMLDNKNSGLTQSKQNGKWNQGDLVKRFVELLEQEQFFGEILLRFDAGRMVHVTKTQGFKTNRLRSLLGM